MNTKSIQLMGNSTELTVPSTRRLKSLENPVAGMIRSDLVVILFSEILYIFHSLCQSFPFFGVFLTSARSSTKKSFGGSNRKSFGGFCFGVWILEYYLIIITMFFNLSNFNKNNIILL